MILKILQTLLILILTTPHSLAQKSDEQNLKKYFFYRCVDEGHKEINFQKYDGSTAYIIDLLPYNFSVIQKISSFAKKTAQEIPTSNYTGKKSVLTICLEMYESTTLNDFVKKTIKQHKNR